MTQLAAEREALVAEGTLETGSVVRHVLYGVRTGTSYVLTGNPTANERIRADAEDKEAKANTETL